MNAESKTLDGMSARAAVFDFETFFHGHYDRVARVIARVVKDPARAEELAVDVFWKLWRNPGAQGEQAGGWLYRTAVRQGLDELRRTTRRHRYESLSQESGPPGPPTPEEVHALAAQQEQVRRVLARLEARQAELLVLRSQGMSYGELAAALELNPASVGTFVSRAQQAFRKEYVKHYGNQ